MHKRHGPVKRSYPFLMLMAVVSPMDNEKDIFGNPPKDIQGNPTDKNIQGNRPEDVQGNAPKDFYGNPTGEKPPA